jgi:hypothetical protein
MRFQAQNIVPRLLVVSLCLLLGASFGAIGTKYDYSASIKSVPVSGTGTIAVEVVDERPYVVSHEKNPNFVGLARGGFGNTFNVGTVSGQPMADEMRTAIAAALQRQGFTVVAKGEPAPRKLELKILEWKTDVMARMKVLYDLTVTITDEQGQALAQSSTKGEEVLGGSWKAEANSTNAAASFELHFVELLRDPKVQGALTGQN